MRTTEIISKLFEVTDRLVDACLLIGRQIAVKCLELIRALNLMSHCT